MGMPIKDLDFVLEGDAPSLAARLAEETDGRLVVHPTFGTASVLIDDATTDLVTARGETYPSPGALPIVTPSSIGDDLARRDFTINAMAVPLGRENPNILDPHGGIEDIRNGVVRVLHDASFIDDPTRLLRAVRYEQRLGFRVEDGTLGQLEEAVANGCLSTVSGDRLRHELERIFEEDRPAPAVIRSVCLGMLAGIHPSLSQAAAVERFAALAQDSIHEPGAGNATESRSPLSYLSALAYPLTPGDAEGVISRFNMPSDWARMVRDTVELRGLEPRLAARSFSNSQVVELLEPFDEVAVLTAARVTDVPLAAERLGRYLGELSHLSTELDGRDLLALGVPEGPMMGKILKELRDAKLDGRIRTMEDERRVALDILALGGKIGNK